MSRASTYTLDHQWDPYEILNVERDRRCNGWLPSMGRKCRNVVNWKDMDTFYRLLDDLSSHALDTTRLQPRLRALAAVGLCKQVHRCSQIDDTVDKWSKKIRAAARRVELEELEVESYYSRTDTRSSTASFRAPASRRTRSSTSTDTARTSSTAQDEIDSTLRCLEAARDQQRILERRLPTSSSMTLYGASEPRPHSLANNSRSGCGTAPLGPFLGQFKTPRNIWSMGVAAKNGEAYREIHCRLLALDLLKDEMMTTTTIAAPFKIIASSESNTQNNNRKAKRIKTGTNALAELDEARESEAQESAEDGGVTPAQPMSTALAAQSLLRLSSSSLLDVLNALKQQRDPG
ncbi:hypothetical protein E8E11_003377 [Didymella keratinophila]|nr:hypothetical protein E8E11_003377 [Didymella keratinophila]